jgi:hypothetical protein
MQQFLSMVLGAPLQSDAADGDRLLIKVVDAGLMRLVPAGGEMRVPVGAQVATALVLEDAAFPVVVVVQPDGSGGFFCELFEDRQGPLDGTRRRDGDAVHGPEDEEMLLDGARLWIEADVAGPYTVAVLLADRATPAAVADLRDTDSAAYWDALAAWARESGGKIFRRRFLAE